MMNRDQLQSCIEACYTCAATCDTCASACLQENDVKMMAKCIALDIDCAEIGSVALAKYNTTCSTSLHDSDYMS